MCTQERNLLIVISPVAFLVRGSKGEVPEKLVLKSFMVLLHTLLLRRLMETSAKCIFRRMTVTFVPKGLGDDSPDYLLLILEILRNYCPLNLNTEQICGFS